MARVKLTIGVVVVVCVSLVAGGAAHSIPTHLNITAAVVGWLLDVQPPGLQCTPAGKAALAAALAVGTEQEDNNYQDSTSAARMGRYQFHFRPALDDSFAVIEIGPIDIAGTKVSLGKLDIGVFRALNSCSSLEWGGFARSTPGDVTCSYNALRFQNLSITNTHTWGNALANAKKASTDPKYAGLGQGFVDLGYLIHLVEDQSSPAHALGAAHGHAAIPVDIMAAIDPQLKGAPVDLGFPDEMEVDPTGADAKRDVPSSRWPARQISQIMDAAPDQILLAMHAKTTSQGYKRETMAQRTARMFKNVETRVEGRLPDIVKGLGLPWPLGNKTLAEDIARVKRNVAQIVRDEVEKEAKAEIAATLGRSSEAAREWDVLGPEAVRLGGSLLWRYIKTATPAMGSGCKYTPPGGF